MATSTTKVTVVAVFSNISTAESAAGELASNGFSMKDIYLHSGATAAVANQTRYAERHPAHSDGGIKGWFKSLFRGEQETEEQRNYEEAFRSGNTILALETIEQYADRAADIINRHSPLNVHEEASGPAATNAGTSVGTAGSVGTASSGRTSTDSREKEPGFISAVKEQLTVGKRGVARGGARIYSRIVEEPVEERVRLREERLRIERTPVDRPANETHL